MTGHLRIARPVTDLSRSVQMYQQGLGLEILGGFHDHEGFDGMMLGHRGAQFHFEFTISRAHPVSPAATPEDLLVFYEPEPEIWERRCKAMLAAGFEEVKSFNPYWAKAGRTFEDKDRCRVVIQRAAWADETASEPR